MLLENHVLCHNLLVELHLLVGPGRALRKSVAEKVVISFLGMSNLILVFKIVS
jgi:hypothetical protein